MSRVSTEPGRPDISKTHLTLLVIDDEPEICQSVYHLLRQRYNVLTTHSASEGLALMTQYEVGIIFTDQLMPDLSSAELLSTLKTKHPDAIQVLYSGYTDLESIVEAVNLGHINRFISKPWLPEELMSAVDEAAQEYHRITQTYEELEGYRKAVQELQDENGLLRNNGKPKVP